MSKSTHLRLRDMRGVFRLIFEVQDISERHANTAIWRRHLAEGLQQLLGASQVVCHHWGQFTPAGDVQLLEVSHCGWNSAKAMRYWHEQATAHGFRAEPLTDRMSRMTARAGVWPRRSLISDREWERSDVIRGMVDICEFDDVLAALFRLRTDDQVSGLALNRRRGDGRFSVRDLRMLRLLNGELHRIYSEGKLRMMGEQASALDERARLPQRSQQVLELLLKGQSLKEVAGNLSLSRHTVNDHVKVIHRTLGVSTRAELLAHCLGVRPQKRT